MLDKIVHNAAIFIKWRDERWPFDIHGVAKQGDHVIVPKVRPNPYFSVEML
jgi:hypothetical protein